MSEQTVNSKKGALRRAGAKLVGQMNLEGFSPVVEYRQVHVSQWQKDHPKLRVAHLTDIHMSSIIPDFLLQKTADLLTQAKPDVLCYTGDYIHQFWDIRHLGRMTDILSAVNPALGAFACPGNHDYRFQSLNKIRRKFEAGGVAFLVNEKADLSHQGKGVEVVGAGEWLYRDTKVDHLLTPREAGHESVRMTLVHNPDAYEVLLEKDHDLMLSGHTHGGQISLPMVGSPVTPVRGAGKPFQEGFFKAQDTYINVNRGLGMVVLPFRYMCPPEITILDVMGSGEGI